MGRVEIDSSKRVKRAPEVARHLLKSCPSLRDFQSFMFGSSLNGIGSDFDLLIVGPSGDLLVLLKTELREAGRELPLDILFMLPEEAEFTDFVRLEGCIPLVQLAHSDGNTNGQVCSQIQQG